METPRTYSRYNTHAVLLMGTQIKLGRKEHRWSEQELAERAGISRSTVQKIERGDMSCAIGLVFEVAALVGIKLFDSDNTSLLAQIERAQDKIALLPKTIHKTTKDIDDDF